MNYIQQLRKDLAEAKARLVQLETTSMEAALEQYVPVTERMIHGLLVQRVKPILEYLLTLSKPINEMGNPIPRDQCRKCASDYHDSYNPPCVCLCHQGFKLLEELNG